MPRQSRGTATSVTTLLVPPTSSWSDDEQSRDVIVHFRTGEVIFAQRQEADCVYVILDGKVKIDCHAADGRACTFAVMGAGDIIGEVPMHDGRRHASRALALTAVRAMAQNRARFHAQLAADPSSADDLLRVLARRIRRTSEDIVDVMSTDLVARVAKQLLRLAQRFGDQHDGGTRLTLDLNQEEFAQLVGTSRESVNRALSEFVANGWIRVDRDAITIVDLQPLVHRLGGSH